MDPQIDHIQVTVPDLEAAEPFYDALLSRLGFDLRYKVRAEIADHDLCVVEYGHRRLSLAISSPRAGLAAEPVHRRRPGALHHLAFRVESRAEVDRLHAELDGLGATIVSPPREYPEYSPAGYYAFFLEDPGGIKYEIVNHAGAGR